MPSVNHSLTRLGALGACVALLTGVAVGCSTTQEKAERQQARSAHILKARAERQQARKHDKGQPGKQDKKGS